MDSHSSAQFSVLLDRHGAALVLYAQQWCEVPEDVVQEALIALWRQPQWPDNAVGWLYRVVRNGAIDARRSARRRSNHEASAAQGRREMELDWFAATDTSTLETADVTQALATLPIEQRETIVARLWSGLTFTEIAQLTETSTSTAHRRYVEGLTALKERLVTPCPQQKTPIH